MTVPPIHELLPHRPPMLLVDAVTEFGHDWAKCTATPREDGLFDRHGSVPALVCIEYMAQSVGALAGLLRHQSGGKPQIGYLIAVRHAVLHVDAVRIGEPLTIHVQSVWSDGSAAHFECKVECASTPIAQGQLTVYEPSDTATKAP